MRDVFQDCRSKQPAVRLIIDAMKPYQNKSASPIRVADIVVTFLFKYYPDLLHAFLKVSRHPVFSLTRIEVAGRGRRDFSIERSGLTVTVSGPSLLKNSLADLVP